MKSRFVMSNLLCDASQTFMIDFIINRRASRFLTESEAMTSNYEWIDCTHMACSGQGCAACRHSGIETVLIDTSKEGL